MLKFLPEICNIQYGYAFDSAKFNTTNTGVPLIRIRDVLRGYSETYTTEECTQEYIVQNGDILIGMDGEFNIARWNGGKAYLNQRVCRLIPSSEIDSTYLFYFMPKALKAIEDKTSFVTVKHLSAKELNKVLVLVPSIQEQKKMANSLQQLDEMISLRKQQLSKLDELVKSRFIELFGTIHDNKLGYEIKTLQDVCEQIKDGTHQTPTYTDDRVNGYKFLSSKDVTTGKIDWTHLKYIPEELHNELYARIAPKKGDILLAKNGTTGIAAIVDRDEIFDIYVSLALLRPIEINVVYLWAAINSVETKQQFDSSLKGIGVPNLHLGEIKKARIIVPPIELQKQFAAFVEQTDKSKLAIQKSLEKLEILKKSLMQQYFG